MADKNFIVKNGLGAPQIVLGERRTEEILTTTISTDSPTVIDSFGQNAARLINYDIIIIQGDGEAYRRIVAGERIGIPYSAQTNSFDVFRGEYSGPWIWTTRNGPSETEGIAYGNGVWVAVGGNDALLTSTFGRSTDGVAWVTTATPPLGTGNPHTGLTFGADRFVAVARNGGVSTSTDGLTWTTRTSNFGSTAINTVAFANGLYVAAGNSGQLRTSTDAITWVTRTSNFGTSNIVSLAWGNNLWVAGGDSGQLRTSTDAITWVTRTSGFAWQSIGAVSFGGNMWVAGGGYLIRRSTDTITWTSVPNAFVYNTIESIHFAENRFAAVGGGGLRRESTDGFTWVSRPSNTTSSAIKVVTFANNTWVAGGSFTGGIVSAVNSNPVAAIPATITFENVQTWVTTATVSGINAMTFGNPSGTKTWAAFASSNILTSTDLVTWTTRTSNFGSTAIGTVAYANGIFAAGGNSGQLRTSTDAITWVTRTSNFGTSNINSIDFGDGLWVAGGSYGQIRTSTDTITWATRTSNFGNTLIRVVKFGNGLWVAGGYSGQLRTSTDAITWVTRTSNFGTTTISRVIFGGDIWVAVGSSGQIRSSTDAVTWVTRTLNLRPDQATAGITGLAYGNGLFTAIYNEDGRISTDGISWANINNINGTSASTGLPAYPQTGALAYGDNRFVATGSGHVQVERESDRTLRLTATVRSGFLTGSSASVVVVKESLI